MRKTVSTALLLTALLPALTGAEEGAPAQPTYFELKPSLIANLNTGAKYVRADVQLMTLDAELAANMELHAPALRHELLMLISEQDGARLNTAEGKEDLRQKAMDVSRKTLRELTGKGTVDELFFTAFFVQ